MSMVQDTNESPQQAKWRGPTDENQDWRKHCRVRGKFCEGLIEQVDSGRYCWVVYFYQYDGEVCTYNARRNYAREMGYGNTATVEDAKERVDDTLENL